MRRTAMALVGAAFVTITACSSGSQSVAPQATTTPKRVVTTTFPDASTKTANCRAQGALPDHACTPGALNPAVTQDSVATTICTTGWAASVRPTSTVTDRLKAQAATAYGISDALSGYEGDHLIPLELGGALADIANFWDQPNQLTLPDGTIVAAGQKDALENTLKTSVCAERTTLIDAQRQIAGDWYGAWTAAGRPGAAGAPVLPAVAVPAVTSPAVTSPAVTTPATTTVPAPPPTSRATVPTTMPSSVVYANCAAARAAGAAPIHRGEPGYSLALDRDGDGIACE
jgi:hypothetical protein